MNFVLKFLFPIAVPSAVPDLADRHVDIDGDAGGGGLCQVVVVRLRTQFNMRLLYTVWFKVQR
jgi:hypothetical protein